MALATVPKYRELNKNTNRVDIGPRISKLLNIYRVFTDDKTVLLSIQMKMATVHKNLVIQEFNKNSFNVRMNDDPQLYSNYNNVTRRDATEILEEYANKLKWNRTGERILDIGSADGSVTRILIKFVPDDHAEFIGCDINEKVVDFANNYHGNEKTKFIVLNIEDDHVPNELRESFDHVFSFYTLHWIRNQEKGFTNIFNLLSESGQCLLTFLGRATIYSLFEALSRTTKWGPWLKDIDKFLSPYYDCHDPDRKIAKMLKKIGFQDIDVRCTQKVYVYENPETLKKNVTSVSPFKIPEDLLEDFLDDFLEVARDMRIVDGTTNAITFNYNLITVYCKK